MIGTIVSSLIVTFSGGLIDRFGTRLMIVVSSLGLGAALMLLSYTEPIIHLLKNNLPVFLNSMIGFTVMVFIFLWLRYFGQGIMTMVSRVTLSKWFEARRGFASGISGVVVSFGFSGSPLVLNLLIVSRGWVQAAVSLAMICGLGMAVIGWVFFRDNPEECGLKMDGKAYDKKEQNPDELERAVTLKEAVRSYNFWVFNVGLCSYSLIVTGIVFHMSFIGSLAGLSRMESFSIFLPMSVFSLITHFLSGWISDRISLKYLLMVMMVSTGLASFGFLDFGNTWARALVIVSQGVMGGLFGCLTVVAWPRFFGRKHLGAISGLSMGCLVFSSAIGPPLFGLAESLTGNYQPAFWVCISIAVGLFIASARAKSYLSR
jgi:sugar phosphate permease